MATKKSKKVEDIVKDIETPKDMQAPPMTPSEYFDILNKRAQEATEKSIRQMYENAKQMMKKYKITGQKSGAMKLYRFAELCEREIAVIQAGYTVYINRQDLDEYIEKISAKEVVINYLHDYERDIPDDVVDKIADCKDKELFDEYVIVFTDYTGKERKKVEAARREKDPILLGILKIGDQVSTRLYHIASWEDAYCDLTLDRMVKEFDAKHKNDKNFESMAKSVCQEYGDFNTFKKSFEQSNGQV